VNSPHLHCGAGYPIPRLASASGKEGVEVTRGVEDHVKFVAVALNTALEVVRRKGESALFRVLADIDATVSIYATEDDRRVRGSLLSQV